MKKALVLMAAAAFMITAVSAYACGDKKTGAQSKAAKAETTKAGEMGSCGSEAKAAKADMTMETKAGAEVQKADFSSNHCSEAKGANADMSNCPYMGKEAKASMSGAGDACGTEMKGDAKAMKANAGDCGSSCGSKATKANETKTPKAAKVSSKSDLASTGSEAPAATPVNSAK